MNRRPAGSYAVVFRPPASKPFVTASAATVASPTYAVFPAAFQLTERTEEEWTALRDALANEVQSNAGITAEDQTWAALLETARDDEDVTQAQSNLANNLASVNDAYYSAVATLGE